MKERLQGLTIGIIIGALTAGGSSFAKNAIEQITVTYDNIKVYKDNVLCELKDSNGRVIEPFIYNGTTYMPVRGSASLAGMEVTWDGPTKSVYLWDKITAVGTYLMEVCPPYESYLCRTYLQTNGESFQMAGTKYSNGFTLYCGSDNSNAFFNLDSKYSTIDLTVGHVDDSNMKDASVSFIVDGKLVKEIQVGAEDLPKTVSIPVNYGLQLKIVANSSGNDPSVGFGNITVN